MTRLSWLGVPIYSTDEEIPDGVVHFHQLNPKMVDAFERVIRKEIDSMLIKRKGVPGTPHGFKAYSGGGDMMPSYEDQTRFQRFLTRLVDRNCWLIDWIMGWRRFMGRK